MSSIRWLASRALSEHTRSGRHVEHARPNRALPRGDQGAEVLRLRRGRQRHRRSRNTAAPAPARRGHLSVRDRAAADLPRELAPSGRGLSGRRANARPHRPEKPRGRIARSDRTLSARHRRAHPEDAQVPGREHPHPRPGAAAHRGRRVRPARAVLPRPGAATPGAVPAVEGPRGGAGQHGEPVRQVRLHDSVPPRRAAGRGDEHQGSRQGHRPRRLEPQHLARGEAGPAQHHRRALPPREALGDPQSRDRAARARPQDPVAGADRAQQEPERVLPAPADEGDPEGARRGRFALGRARGAAPQDRRSGHAGGGPQGRRQRDGAAEDHPAGIGRAQRGPHLPRVAREPAVVEVDRGQPRDPARARGARRGPLRPREDQGPHPRVSRRTQAQEGPEGTDPLLRRPAGHRQDLARTLDRARDRTQVPAHLARRRARRSGDSRAPPHLHRRAPRPHHPSDPQCELEQPAVHARRDRQARDGLPRRSRLGAARGARPGAELHVRRSLPRRSVRPVEGDVHHHRELSRADAAGVA